MSQLGQIGQNGVNEFFEEITFGVGNSVDVIGSLPETDVDIINEAMKSGVSIMKMGVMMMVINKQEVLLEKVMSILFAGVGATLMGATRALRRGLGRFRGIRALRRIPLFSQSTSDNIALCRLGAELAINRQTQTTAVNSASDRLNVGINQRQSLIAQDEHRLNLAQSKSQNYTQSLMFKLFAQGFTDKDKTIIKRILGKDATSNLDMNELNQISNFMYVKDSNGNITGLSQEFMALINALGYLHNK